MKGFLQVSNFIIFILCINPSPTSAAGPPSPKMGEGFWFSVATDAGALVFAGQQQPATLSEFSFSMREKVAVRPDEGILVWYGFLSSGWF